MLPSGFTVSVRGFGPSGSADRCLSLSDSGGSSWKKSGVPD